MILLAIDPGPAQSAWLVYNHATGALRQFGITPNADLLAQLDLGVSPEVTAAVIEKVEGFGMAVGIETFETVFWSGRFAQALQPLPVDRIGRKAVKVHLCGTTKAKDPNIRQALIDRFGGPAAIRKGGPIYGVHADLWAALAVAVTFADTAAAA